MSRARDDRALVRAYGAIMFQSGVLESIGRGSLVEMPIDVADDLLDVICGKVHQDRDSKHQRTTLVFGSDD